MELKKSSKANLEQKRGVFILLGLAFSLGITLLAFEWTTEVKQADSLGEVVVADVEEEFIPITREETVVETAPPPVQTVVDVLNIVDDDTEIEEELVIEDTEADQETIIEIAPIIEQEDEVETDTKIFSIVEESPEFPGGEAALINYLSSHVKYPIVAQENGIQGKVYVKFVVNRDGSVSDAVVLRGVNESLDKEALRVVNTLPTWKPGKQGGKTVRVSYQVPISFKLQ